MNGPTIFNVTIVSSYDSFKEDSVLVAGDAKKIKAALAEYRKAFRRWCNIDDLSEDCSAEDKRFARAWTRNFQPPAAKTLVSVRNAFIKFLESKGLEVVRPKQASIKII